MCLEALPTEPHRSHHESEPLPRALCASPHLPAPQAPDRGTGIAAPALTDEKTVLESGGNLPASHRHWRRWNVNPGRSPFKVHVLRRFPRNNREHFTVLFLHCGNLQLGWCKNGGIEWSHAAHPSNSARDTPAQRRASQFQKTATRC